VPIAASSATRTSATRTITVERPLRDAAGQVVLGEKGKQKGKPQPDSACATPRTCRSPRTWRLLQARGAAARPDAWIDHEKTKVGYEIPFNRHFYVFEPPRGSTSFHYVMLRPVKHVWPPYFAHLLKSPTYIQALRRTTDLIRDGQELRFSNFAQVDLPVVPLDEQKAIAVFLDRETAKIDALIAEQERLIALLAEKRQATISHAVTKGLDPKAPMKDSGVAWLGDVPAHWDVRPLKHLVQLKSGGTPSKENPAYWDGGIPWASAKDLKVEQLHDTADHISQAAVDDGAASLVPQGAVLVVVRGMILARMFPVVEATCPMAINQDLKAVVPNRGLDTSFLAWLLRGSATESLTRLDEAGHGTKALRMDAWTSMNLPIPPQPEQLKLAEFISAETAKLDSLCTEADKAVTLLKERRSALIAAAVTGQIDVRNA
jgi:type I restriction enzyme S subunit